MERNTGELAEIAELVASGEVHVEYRGADPAGGGVASARAQRGGPRPRQARADRLALREVPPQPPVAVAEDRGDDR